MLNNTDGMCIKWWVKRIICNLYVLSKYKKFSEFWLSVGNMSTPVLQQYSMSLPYVPGSLVLSYHIIGEVDGR